MWPNPQESPDLVTFTKEILNGKLLFLCSALLSARIFLSKENKCALFAFLLRLCVTQKALQLSYYFFLSLLFFFLAAFFGQTFHDFLLKKRAIKIGLISLDTLKEACVKIVPSVVIHETCGTWHAYSW